jgi:hypothetical protein
MTPTEQYLHGIADHCGSALGKFILIVTVVYAKRGLGITALEPTRGR